MGPSHYLKQHKENATFPEISFKVPRQQCRPPYSREEVHTNPLMHVPAHLTASASFGGRFHNCHGYKLNSNAGCWRAKWGGQTQAEREQRVSGGNSGGWRGGAVVNEDEEEGVIFSATGERNHKWLDANPAPPSK